MNLTRSLAVLLLLIPVNGVCEQPQRDGPILEEGWYVREGACPFECCVYGEWSVENDTDIYDQVRSNTAVGKAVKGQTVQALTGTLYVIPVPIKVVHQRQLDALRLEAGDEFQLLDYIGEGVSRIWFRGGEHQIDAYDLYEEKNYQLNLLALRNCSPPSRNCWWQVQPDRLERTREWWVQIRLPDGTVGWTMETHRFGNKDACS